MSYYLFITGCYQNYYDAKHIAHLLEKMGYVLDNEKNANVIVAIACSVRQKPIDRIFGKIKVWNKLPQKPKVIITGCILEKDKPKFSSKKQNALIIDINDIDKKLPLLLKGKVNIKLKPQTECIPLDINKDAAFIPIMFGCDNFCSYCAVPYTRGREWSKKENEILDEIKKQIKNNKKHIMLLGQNVNSYGLDKNNKNKFLITNISHSEFSSKSQKSKKISNYLSQLVSQSKARVRDENLILPFAKLLEEIDKIPGNFTFNFTSSNPHDFHKSLVDTLPKLKKWEKKLHLPIQSGDDEILKKMNRKYSTQDYLSLIKDLKIKIKDLKISTDVIVGFPGETKKQFQNTVEICKKVGFYKVFAAQYSPRPGTLAEKKYKDNIAREEKKHRWDIINNLINK